MRDNTKAGLAYLKRGARTAGNRIAAAAARRTPPVMIRKQKQKDRHPGSLSDAEVDEILREDGNG